MKSLIVGFLVFLIASGVSANENRDIEGMLYTQKIPDSLWLRIRSEIQSMDRENCIQWKDKAGRTRKTFEFGYSFKEIEKNRQVVKYDIPSFLVEARRQIVDIFKEQLHEKDPEKYENCIITFYSEGDGIKAHTDKRYFGPDILGVIITPDTATDGEGSSSNLYFTKDSEKPIVLSEEAGMAYLITGELRTLWQHQLDPVATERVSIQFRTIDTEILDSYL